MKKANIRYCPVCRSEWQDRVEICSDCRSPLVDKLPIQPVPVARARWDSIYLYSGLAGLVIATLALLYFIFVEPLSSVVGYGRILATQLIFLWMIRKGKAKRQVNEETD